MYLYPAFLDAGGLSRSHVAALVYKYTLRFEEKCKTKCSKVQIKRLLQPLGGKNSMKFDASASKDFATVPELAALWRCTEQHVYKLIRRGALPAFRIGGRIIVRRDAAKRFLEGNATVSAAA